jgi:hypothetical protein
MTNHFVRHGGWLISSNSSMARTANAHAAVHRGAPWLLNRWHHIIGSVTRHKPCCGPPESLCGFLLRMVKS